MSETSKRIAIACEDDRGLDGEVSPHFGRCPYYAVVDLNGCEVTAARTEANPHYRDHRPGVVPRFLASLGVDVVIAGGMGPRAHAMFRKLGIAVATGVLGTVHAVLQAYLDGKIGGFVPCNHDHPNGCGER